MKKFALFLVLGLLCFVVGVKARQGLLLSPPQRAEPVSSFAPAPYPLRQRPFVVVISSRNNGAFVEKILSSVFAQVYNEMRIVYIDDASDDGSGHLAHDLILQSDVFSLTTFVQNEAPLGFFANLARVVEGCANDEIVVALSEGAWLAHEWVISCLNQYYTDPDLWVSCSRACLFPSYEKKEGGLYAFSSVFFKKALASEAVEDFRQTLIERAEGHFSYLPEVLMVEANQ